MAFDTGQATRTPWLSFKEHFRITKFIMEAGTMSSAAEQVSKQSELARCAKVTLL